MIDTGPRFELGDEVVHRSHGAVVIARTFSQHPTYDLLVNGVVVARVPEEEIEPAERDTAQAGEHRKDGT